MVLVNGVEKIELIKIEKKWQVLNMNFSTKDKEWIDKCKNNPNKYKIYVDNDDVSVVIEKDGEEEAIYSFTNFGYDFIVQILNYIGCNADWV